MSNTPDVIFPYIGIQIQYLEREAFNIFGLSVYWYGVFVVLGILAGVCAPWFNAKRDAASADKRSGDPITTEQVLDFAYIVIPLSLVGTRLYYVFSMWGQYKDNLLDIFNVRGGGLAIHGAILTGVLTTIVYAKVKKMNALRLADICVVGLPIGQAIGRWGNFVNQEVFGRYTNNPFAMCYKLEAVNTANVTPDILDNLYKLGGQSYIQVHPTFLYESFWSLLTFIALMLYFNRRKFHGEILALYLLAYGVGRFWIEGLRTDQLKFLGTGLPGAQVLSVVMVLGAAVFLIARRAQVSAEKRQTGRRA